MIHQEFHMTFSFSPTWKNALFLSLLNVQGMCAEVS